MTALYHNEQVAVKSAYPLAKYNGLWYNYVTMKYKRENFIARLVKEYEAQLQMYSYVQCYTPSEMVSNIVEQLGRYAAIANEFPDYNADASEMEEALVQIAASCAVAYEVL